MELRNAGLVGGLGASIFRSVGGRDLVSTFTDLCGVRQSFQTCMNWCAALIPGLVGSNGHLELGWWQIVCLYRCPSQNRTVLPAVAISPVPLWYSSCKSSTKHCGDKMQMGLLGMNQMLGSMNSWSAPLSSRMSQQMVPMPVVSCFVPPSPMMDSVRSGLYVPGRKSCMELVHM
jgi:hypothetical protein